MLNSPNIIWRLASPHNSKNSNWLDKSVFFSVLLIAFLLSLVKISNYDFWWILADGRYIVDNLTVPSTDVFRFVSIDKEYEWYNHLYLTGTIFYVVYLISGLSGLVLFKAVISAITFGVFSSSLKTINSKNLLIAIPLITLTIFAVRFRLLLRPDIYSFLFFVIVYWIVLRFKSGVNAHLWCLPLVHMIWVNLHGGYFAGLVLLFTVLFSEGSKLFLNKHFHWEITGLIAWERIKNLSFYTLISFAAIIVNPFGVKAYVLFADFVFSHRGLDNKIETARVGEWQALDVSHFKGLGICFTSEYGVILGLFLISCILVRKKIDITDLVLSAGFFYASTVSIRFIPFAAFIMVPVIFRNYSHIESVYPSILVSRLFKSIIVLLILGGVLLGVKGLSVPPTFKFGLGLPEGKFPADAVQFIKTENIKGNFFNTYGIGGYLIWEFYPERRVFMDGRVLDNIEAYYDMVGSASSWDMLVEEYNIGIAILDNGKKDFVYHLLSNPAWTLVYWDDNALIFLKNIKEYNKIIEKYGYYYTRPNFMDVGYLEQYLYSDKITKLVFAELSRNISTTKYNDEARLAISYIYFSMGRDYYNKAIKELEFVVASKPDLARGHSALGLLYMEKGMKEQGLKELEKAISIDPHDPLANDVLSQKSHQ